MIKYFKYKRCIPDTFLRFIRCHFTKPAPTLTYKCDVISIEGGYFGQYLSYPDAEFLKNYYTELAFEELPSRVQKVWMAGHESQSCDEDEYEGKYQVS